MPKRTCNLTSWTVAKGDNDISTWSLISTYRKALVLGDAIEMVATGGPNWVYARADRIGGDSQEARGTHLNHAVQVQLLVPAYRTITTPCPWGKKNNTWSVQRIWQIKTRHSIVTQPTQHTAGTGTSTFMLDFQHVTYVQLHIMALKIKKRTRTKETIRG
jgi:hypothetical protein